MTLDKILIPSFIIIVLAACSKNSDDLNEPGDYGYHLAFRHVPTDTMIVLENDYQPTIIDTSCADLHICIMSSLREELGHLTPQHYFSKGDAEMEQQIKEFLDPEGKKYNGTIPIHIDYCHPMLFAQAHFIFPGLQKDIFANGNYVKVEIELANGFICANGSRGQPT